LRRRRILRTDLYYSDHYHVQLLNYITVRQALSVEILEKRVENIVKKMRSTIIIINTIILQSAKKAIPSSSKTEDGQCWKSYNDTVYNVTWREREWLSTYYYYYHYYYCLQHLRFIIRSRSDRFVRPEVMRTATTTTRTYVILYLYYAYILRSAICWTTVK